MTESRYRRTFDRGNAKPPMSLETARQIAGLPSNFTRPPDGTKPILRQHEVRKFVTARDVRLEPDIVNAEMMDKRVDSERRVRNRQYGLRSWTDKDVIECRPWALGHRPLLVAFERHVSCEMRHRHLLHRGFPKLSARTISSVPSSM